MFESHIPKHKVGVLLPLSIVDNAAYEFYRLAPKGVMLVMIPVGLEKFSKEDVERVFAPLDTYVDQLMERGVDIIMQSGVPLPILIGIDGHDRLLDRIAKHSGLPVTSSVLGVVAAAIWGPDKIFFLTVGFVLVIGVIFVYAMANAGLVCMKPRRRYRLPSSMTRNWKGSMANSCRRSTSGWTRPCQPSSAA